MIEKHGSLIYGTEDEIMEAIREKERQEPCDDAISRMEALKCLNGAWGDYSVLNEVYERISKLPSVTQKSDNKYRKEAKRWKNKWLKSHCRV